MSADFILAAMTKEGESDAHGFEGDMSDADNIQADVGTSNADEEVLLCVLQATHHNETERGERKPFDGQP